MTALHRLSATTLAAMVRRGDVSIEELTTHFLARIARRNEALQAFVYVADFWARRSARRLDAARRRGELPQSPLAGLPLGIKDLYPVRFMPIRGGSRALGPMIAPVDGSNVRRLREAGVVILGKLATAEFGAMPFTEPDIHPPTRNPWDLSTTAGGSSGGTGAAVAAGLVPLGHGSDGGGSIRIPAAMCGLFGFKPSRGALFHAVAQEKLKLATEGPLAHSVDDAVALLQVLATDDRFAQPLAPPSGLAVRLVLESSDPTAAPVHPRMAEVTTRVASVLSALGHHVEPRGPLPLSVEAFLPLWQRTLASVPTVRPFGDRLQPITRWLRDAGAMITETQALSRRDEVTAAIDAWWGDADLVVTPTVACLPPQVGSWRDDDPARAFSHAIPMAIFTAGFNGSGQPAMNIPVVVSGSHQPLGVQVVARHGQDALLLAVARQLEAALGGFDHRPADDA